MSRPDPSPALSAFMAGYTLSQNGASCSWPIDMVRELLRRHERAKERAAAKRRDVHGLMLDEIAEEVRAFLAEWDRWRADVEVMPWQP